ncbi:hypothetical protein B7463_g12715, partial [Scytalidium lignicola]
MKYMDESVTSQPSDNGFQGELQKAVSLTVLVLSALASGFALLAVFLFLQLGSSNGLGTFEQGFITDLVQGISSEVMGIVKDNILDLANARSKIELQSVRFTGGIRFDESGTAYQYYDQEQVVYFGSQNQAIDDAWKELLAGEVPICMSIIPS